LSALTKVFVVLHVVLTMLFVSATIVFVNRVENAKAAQARSTAEVQRLTREAQFATNQARVAEADAAAVRQQSADAIRAVRQDLATAQGDVRERDAQIAALKQDVASAQASLQAATAALSTAQDSNKVLTAQIGETRTAADKIQQQNTEVLTAIADRNSKLQVATRRIRNLEEELEAAQTALAEVQDRGGPAQASAAGGTAEPAIVPAEPINGIVRDRRTVNGVPYATISVGSQDGVTKNMVFNVIQRGPGGDFLGYLRVDRVEPTEAVGRLEGPRVEDIQPNTSEVRTQL
jgi:multidrug efflux pump subunit AcrA (membrane-fusion protein)